jgi:membrane protease YdiL (CAAX protease family)
MHPTPHSILVLQWCLLGAGGVLWLIALWRLGRRHPLVAKGARMQASWGLFDVALALVLLSVLSQAARSAVLAWRGPAPALQMLATGAAGLAATVIVAVVVRLRAGGSWRGLGVAPEFFARDFALGTAAFLMLAPLVYGVQWIFVQLFGESQHPVIESLRKEQTSALMAATAFSVLVAAPLVEEFLCRVLLQGWLEKAMAGNASGVQLIAGGDKETEEKPSPPWTGAAAIAASSLIFALLHYTHGPDPVALFVLALGLGYLYRRTHRLLPCVVVHFWNNAFSFAVLLSMLEAD